MTETAKVYKGTGKIYTCIKAASKFYTVGQQYELMKDPSGYLGFIGSDGLFDPKGKVLSEFKEEDTNNVRQPPRLLSVH